MAKYPLNATIKDGIPQWETPEKKIRLLKFFEGKRVTFYIEEYNSTRSLRQNRYLWGVVYAAALQGFRDIGYDLLNEDEVHGIFTEMFLSRKRMNELTGEVLPLIQSTTTLTTVEFEEYAERIRRFSAEHLNISIPTPNEDINLPTT